MGSIHPLRTHYQAQRETTGGRTSSTYSSTGGDDRELFSIEKPVRAFMEGFVSGEEDTSARDQLTIQILTQIRDNLDLIRRKQDSFGDDLHTLTTRVAVIEERNGRMDRIEAKVEREAGRTDALMRDKDQRDGAISVWGWLAKNWPFAGLVGALGAFVAWANGKV